MSTGRWLGAAAGLAAVVAGALAGVLGAFYSPESPGGLPVSALATGVVLPVLSRLGVRLLGSRSGAVLPVAGWFAAVAVLLLPKGEGDVIVASDAAGLLFLAVGFLVGPAVALLAPAWPTTGRVPVPAAQGRAARRR